MVEPTSVFPALSHLPKADLTTIPHPTGFTYRGLTPAACLALAAKNTASANLLDDENGVPASPNRCEATADRTRRDVRYFTALEQRNQSAAAALERFYQLAEAEAKAGLARESFPILDELRHKAVEAKKAGVRFPLDPDDLERQISLLASQLEQAEAGIRLLNIDLRRRLGLPAGPPDERLWPTGDFRIDPTPVDAESAVTAALADRPELRAWRAMYAGLNAETLPAVREQLRGVNPLAGAAVAGIELPCGAKLLLALAKCLGHAPAADPTTGAELEVRRKQLGDIIADRERTITDEARAATVSLNSQTRRVILARDRADAAKAKWDETRRQLDAKLPGADLLEAQSHQDWLKARSELITEVMAWHQARVRLRAAQGWLGWEAAPTGK